MNQTTQETLKLVIGDKNLSSWSLRAWLAIKQAQLTFEEILVLLDRPETKAELLKFSPSQKVPCLIHGDLRIWDSLAICEYLAELAPDKELWPRESAQRALARSYVSEIHSGFLSLRSQLSMDIRLKIEIRHLTLQTINEINRIIFLWENALAKSHGPFLFGSFGIVDAFYAPVVFRFLSYGININSKPVLQYMNSVRNFPTVCTWVEAALREKPASIVLG